MGVEERLCNSLAEALRKLLQGTGIEPGMLRGLDIDPHGPRVVLTAEPPWAIRVVLDMSHDGVEVDLLIEAPRGLPAVDAEEAVLAALESLPSTEALDEYDVAYDPEEGEVVIELHAARLTHIPSLEELAWKSRSALEKLQAMHGKTET